MKPRHVIATVLASDLPGVAFGAVALDALRPWFHEAAAALKAAPKS